MFWMRAAGWGFEEIDPGNVVLIDDAGAVLAGHGNRHLEFAIHTEIMGRPVPTWAASCTPTPQP